MESGGQAHDLQSQSIVEAARFPALPKGALPRALEQQLSAHIRTRRWFRGKARRISGLELLDQLPLAAAPHALVLAIVRVAYAADPAELYLLPLAFAPDDETDHSEVRAAALFEITASANSPGGVVYDPSGSDELSQSLLQLFARPQTLTDSGRVLALPSEALKVYADPAQLPLRARLPTGEQSNTTVFFGQQFMLKLFRQLEAGENPDVELNQFLWTQGYRHVPEPLGSVEYQSGNFVATLGIAQRFVPSRGVAWDVTLDMLQASLEHARSRVLTLGDPDMPSDDLLESSAQALPARIAELLGAYAPFVERLGERTAELHITLASGLRTAAFKPEVFSLDYQRSIAQRARARIAHTLDLLAEQLPVLSPDVTPLAREVIGCRAALLRKLEAVDTAPVHASRIRCHGDYHLGQVLYDGADFIILDFEGEPAQPLEVRRQKQSALYDVCGMLRSFHYAATVALQSDALRSEQRAALAHAGEAWYRWVSAVFLNAYLRKAGRAAVFLPEAAAELRLLLGLHLIDKCSYELGYELNNRPAWVGVPLAGLLSLSKGE